MAKDIVLRPATADDRRQVTYVESQATPKLSYLSHVFEDFLSDSEGEFGVAEMEGRVVGCGKFTVLPDGSAWLESIRVLPSYQGMGIGKSFYRRFFELAEQKDIDTIRMYTGITNAKSRGLAEQFGFRQVGTYRGYRLPLEDVWIPAVDPKLVKVTDEEVAHDILAPLGERWNGFLVMNRTFYAATKTLYADWAGKGRIHLHEDTGTAVVAGARFMPQSALHIAAAGGNPYIWLLFALQKARDLGAARLECMFPPEDEELEGFLARRGFRRDDSDCIVMEIRM